MFIQITLCVLLILGFAWLLWMLSGALLTPVRSGGDTRITLVVQAHGDAPELENLLRGTLWLRDRRGDLKLCKTEEFCQWMQTPIQ